MQKRVLSTKFKRVHKEVNFVFIKCFKTWGNTSIQNERALKVCDFVKVFLVLGVKIPVFLEILVKELY